MRVLMLLAFVLSYITVPSLSAMPFVKADCSDGTDYVIVNDTPYECPIVIDCDDLNLLLNGSNAINVLMNGEGEPFIFYIEKSENRKFEFYSMEYDKSQKKYFDKFNTSIKVEK